MGKCRDQQAKLEKEIKEYYEKVKVSNFVSPVVIDAAPNKFQYYENKYKQCGYGKYCQEAAKREINSYKDKAKVRLDSPTASRNAKLTTHSTPRRSVRS